MLRKASPIVSSLAAGSSTTVTMTLSENQILRDIMHRGQNCKVSINRDADNQVIYDNDMFGSTLTNYVQVPVNAKILTGGSFTITFTNYGAVAATNLFISMGYEQGEKSVSGF